MRHAERFIRPTFIMGMLLLVGGLIFIGSNTRTYEPARQQITDIAQQTTFFLDLIPLFIQDPDQILLMPVPSVSVTDITDTWGAPRGGGRTHEGQDIFAERGASVYSATSGYVLSVRESGRGGKYVYVIGKGGRRYYYAHLDSHAPNLEMGQHVTPDTLLGYVGTTGNAEQTPPHLHFAVYERWNPIDPLPLLIDRE